ncbi:hypothetical protein ACFQY0_13245 [Haloferula chungangensis]|uniref:ABC-type transport auxiliary lipoprotein component domain-containing protein n=1 Tax=Haloferula chungangensis TaxID=1048331 RepID=A0ABW2L901_9BACT
MKVLLPIVALVTILATSCSNTVRLKPSDRSLVSPTRVKNEVGVPEAIEFADTEGADAEGVGATFELVGALLAAPIVEGLNLNEQSTHDPELGERADKGSLILRDEFIKSLRRNKVASVVDSGQKSEFTLTITELGLVPSMPAGEEMRFELEVQATLADTGGRILWESHYGSSPHNDQLPARNLEKYKADNDLLRKDFALTCRYVSDLIIADLKSQMQDEE